MQNKHEYTSSHSNHYISEKTWKKFNQASEAMSFWDRHRLESYQSAYNEVQTNFRLHLKWGNLRAPEYISTDILSIYGMKTYQDTPDRVAQRFIQLRVDEYSKKLERKNNNVVEKGSKKIDSKVTDLMKSKVKLDKEIISTLNKKGLNPEIISNPDTFQTSTVKIERSLAKQVQKSNQFRLCAEQILSQGNQDVDKISRSSSIPVSNSKVEQAYNRFRDAEKRVETHRTLEGFFKKKTNQGNDCEKPQEPTFNYKNN